jgi:hypothetical protein
LGTARVDRDPARVSYVVDPTEDSVAGRVVADHAYWVSGLAPRGKGDATVDVRSGGFGRGIAPVQPVQTGAGVLTGGEIPAMAYVERSQSWGATPRASVSDSLTITATNLATMTVDPRRARVGCDAALHVTTDGPLTVRLAGCGVTRHYS